MTREELTKKTEQDLDKMQKQYALLKRSLADTEMSIVKLMGKLEGLKELGAQDADNNIEDRPS